MQLSGEKCPVIMMTQHIVLKKNYKKQKIKIKNIYIFVISLLFIADLDQLT